MAPDPGPLPRQPRPSGGTDPSRGRAATPLRIVTLGSRRHGTAQPDGARMAPAGPVHFVPSGLDPIRVSTLSDSTSPAVNVSLLTGPTSGASLARSGFLPSPADASAPAPLPRARRRGTRRPGRRIASRRRRCSSDPQARRPQGRTSPRICCSTASTSCAAVSGAAPASTRLATSFVASPSAELARPASRRKFTIRTSWSSSDGSSATCSDPGYHGRAAIAPRLQEDGRPVLNCRRLAGVPDAVQVTIPLDLRVRHRRTVVHVVRYPVSVAVPGCPRHANCAPRRRIAPASGCSGSRGSDRSPRWNRKAPLMPEPGSSKDV